MQEVSAAIKMVPNLLHDGGISMKYRSRPEIQASLLEAANGGASKTRLMYKAFLSYLQTISYVNDLLDSGMLEYDSSQEIYRTSSRGTDFLEAYRQLDQLVNG